MGVYSIPIFISVLPFFGTFGPSSETALTQVSVELMQFAINCCPLIYGFIFSVDVALCGSETSSLTLRE
jgi:hypothetical protein